MSQKWKEMVLALVLVFGVKIVRLEICQSRSSILPLQGAVAGAAEVRWWWARTVRRVRVVARVEVNIVLVFLGLDFLGTGAVGCESFLDSHSCSVCSSRGMKKRSGWNVGCIFLKVIGRYQVQQDKPSVLPSQYQR